MVPGYIQVRLGFVARRKKGCKKKLQLVVPGLKLSIEIYLPILC